MQLQQIKRSTITRLSILLAGLVLFSFTSPRGGDRYEVYLNKKLIFQEFVSLANNPKSFQLDRNNYSGEIDVVYSHCGEAGKNRIIKITDTDNKVLKQWTFGNGKDHKSAMNFQVKEMLLAQKDSPVGKLNLYYMSDQLPKGKLLTSIVLVDRNAAP